MSISSLNRDLFMSREQGQNHTGQSIRCIAGVYADLPGIDTLICGIKWRPTINKLRKWYVLSCFSSVIVYSKTSRMPKGL